MKGHNRRRKQKSVQPKKAKWIRTETLIGEKWCYDWLTGNDRLIRLVCQSLLHDSCQKIIKSTLGSWSSSQLLMTNCCFCLVFVTLTWWSKSPCCQFQLWCNRPGIRLDPTTCGIPTTRQSTAPYAVQGVCVHEKDSTGLQREHPVQWQWKSEALTWRKDIKDSVYNWTMWPQNQ